MIRTEFVDNPPKPEQIKRWKPSGSEMESVTVRPPGISASTAIFYDFEKMADYVLLCCAVVDVVERENQKREDEYLGLRNSYAVRLNVFNAYELLKKDDSLDDDGVIATLKKQGGSDVEAPAITHVKRARSALRKGEALPAPVEPERSLVPRYSPKFYSAQEPGETESKMTIEVLIDAWNDCEERSGVVATYLQNSPEVERAIFRSALSENKVPTQERNPSQKYALMLCDAWGDCSEIEQRKAVRLILSTTMLLPGERELFTALLKD